MSRGEHDNSHRKRYELGFILMSALSLVLFIYIFSVHAAYGSNWLIIPVLAMACSIVHILTQRHPHGH